MKLLKKHLSFILCVVLIAALALCTVGCRKKDVSGALANDTPAESNDAGQTEAPAQTVGEGKTQFDFWVVELDGKTTRFVVKTDKETVGEALLDAKLISGDNDKFGLYVKEVNGIEADFNKTGTYWAFYVDGEYAMSGVDTTKIEAGKVYSFKVSK